MHVPPWDWSLPGESRGLVGKEKAVTHEGKEQAIGYIHSSDEALSAESVERRDGAKGNSAHQSTDRTQSRITVTQAGVGYGGRRDLPSLPEVGAVCLNGHARICAGGAGQPVSLPRLLAAHWDRRLSCRLLRTDRGDLHPPYPLIGGKKAAAIPILADVIAARPHTG